MLDAYIIERIRKERLRQQEREREQLRLPLPDPRRVEHEPLRDKPERGSTIVDFELDFDLRI